MGFSTSAALSIGLCTALCLLASDPQQRPGPWQAWDDLDSTREADDRLHWRLDKEPFTGRVRRTEANWTTESELVNGYEHGLHRLLFADGRLARVVPMREGREHGRVVMFHGHGRPYVLEYHQEGKPCGPQMRWASDGEVEREEFLIDEQDVGLSLESIERWPASGTESSQGHRNFWKAVVLARGGAYAESLQALRWALEAGYATPLDAIGLGVLSPLAKDPGPRPGLVELWLEFAREHELTMVAPKEPGEPLLLSVQIVDAVSGAPIPDATFRLHHTDEEGHYFPENTTWNVRLYAAGKSDARGHLWIQTILPGYYAEHFDPDAAIPRHIHFATWASGFQNLGGEAQFSNDPRAQSAQEEVQGIIEIAPREENDPWRGKLLLRLNPKG